MKVTTKQFLGYTLMPRILPQVRALFGSGFGHVAFYIAQIFAAARLLPANHAYLNYQNMGRFGVVMVLLEAGRNLKFTRNNIDQIAIFALILLGGALLMMQLFLLGLSLFLHTAHAAIPVGLGQFFITPNPNHDIAFMLLDRVFGTPIYQSCVQQNILCYGSTMAEGPYPFPYHTAFHDMLMFYSLGVAVIGLLIFMYYAVAIAVETAQTGTPFGRRYNHVWAPIRMVVALALLIPMSMGFNGAQMLTLHIAKWGSSLATNGWIRFVDVLVAASATQAVMATYDKDGTILTTRLVADPQKPKPNELLRYYTVLATCHQAYKRQRDINIEAFLVKNTAPFRSPLLSNNWTAALAFFDNGPVVITFGEYDAASPSKHDGAIGGVRPYCGQITFKPTDLTEDGSVALQDAYYEQFIRNPWRNIDPAVGLALNPPAAPPNLPAPSGQPQAFFREAATNIMAVSYDQDGYTGMMPNDHARNQILGWWDDRLTTVIPAAVAQAIANPKWMIDLNNLGWGGAGIWYNKIAQLNGALISAAANLPTVTQWPEVMKFVAEEKAKMDQGTTGDTLFVPYLSDGVIKMDGKDWPIAVVLNDAYSSWNNIFFSEFDVATGPVQKESSKNSFIDIVNLFFGTQGLYNMRANTDVHPLAQLTSAGKYLLDHAIATLAIGAIGSAGAGLTKLLANVDGPPVIIKALAGMATTIGMLTISIGFILYYVIPFMPFVYFFFQVGGWVKALFEAMVGLPLWALAHIRIDGEGLPGDMAMSGYFLIFEIFLRPILTIFGLIASITIFAAQVQVLNQIFELVVSNVTGFDVTDASSVPAGEVGAMEFVRGGIDQLFFTVIYVIIVYMMAQASFKLVYLIPNNMMRWVGSSVDGFGELAKDAPDSLISTVYGQSQIITNQVSAGGAAALSQMQKK